MRQLPVTTSSEAPSPALAADEPIPHAPSRSPPPGPSLGTSTWAQTDRPALKDLSFKPLEKDEPEWWSLSVTARTHLVFAPGQMQAGPAREWNKTVRVAGIVRSMTEDDQVHPVRSQLASSSLSLVPQQKTASSLLSVTSIASERTTPQVERIRKAKSPMPQAF